MRSSLPASIGTGTLLGDRYRLGAVIARGGMGAVYEGVDERLGRPVAVKVLRAELSSEEEAAKRFEREALLVARLAHPNVAQVLDFGRSAEGAYLVMERVPGTTLSKVLEKEKRVSSQRAAEIGRQALEALASAHAAGVVHRDIKPGNVMVFSSGASGGEIVKLLDFGIARMMETQAYTRLTGTGAIVGTPAYMAPEQARGESVDARTDIYGMGVLLYCLVSGKKPFTGDVVAMLEGVLYGEAPSLHTLVPDALPGLVAIVERAMRKDPARRFQSASEMAQALAPLAAGISKQTMLPEHSGRVERTSLLTPEQLSPAPRSSFEPRSSLPPRSSLEPSDPRASRGSDVSPLSAPPPEARVSSAPSSGARVRDTVVRHRRLLGVGAGLLALGLVAGLGVAGALGAGAWWWMSRQEPTVAAVSPTVAPAAAPPPAGGAPLGGLGFPPRSPEEDQDCERAVACCETMVAAGFMDPRGCPGYRGPSMTGAACRRSSEDWAGVLRSLGRPVGGCGGTNTVEAAPAAADPSAPRLSLRPGQGPEVNQVIAGGTVSWTQVAFGCRGWFSATPQLVLTLPRSSRLRIGAHSSNIDATLAVRLPGGAVACDDDGGEMFDPRLELPTAAEGEYQIFVGTYRGGTGPAALSVDTL